MSEKKTIVKVSIRRVKATGDIDMPPLSPMVSAYALRQYRGYRATARAWGKNPGNRSLRLRAIKGALYFRAVLRSGNK